MTASGMYDSMNTGNVSRLISFLPAGAAIRRHSESSTAAPSSSTVAYSPSSPVPRAATGGSSDAPLTSRTISSAASIAKVSSDTAKAGKMEHSRSKQEKLPRAAPHTSGHPQERSTWK